MEITLDITRSFNGVVDYVNMEVKPIIYLGFPSDIKGEYSFELMNFRLTVDDDICKQPSSFYPMCKDILECKFPYKSVFIYGKAKFNITGVKGADIEFAAEEDFFKGKKIYHTWDYKLQEGDHAYVCGGYASFLPWFTTIYLITDNKNSVKVTFSLDEYLLIDTYDDSFAKSMEAKYIYTSEPGKLFDFDILNKHFPMGTENPAK